MSQQLDRRSDESGANDQEPEAPPAAPSEQAQDRDAQIYAAGADPDLETDAYREWAMRNARQVWSKFD